MSNAIDVTPLNGALGAEIGRVDLNTLGEEQFRQIERAFHDHLVLVFRDQDLEPGAQVDFTRRFGPVEPHPLASRRGIDGHPEVLVLENRPGRRGARNDFWHSDISFAERPPLGSVLHARTVPEGRGDTMFCNMYRAYEGLSAGLRRILDGLQGLHSAEALALRNNADGGDAQAIAEVPPPRAHPAVRTHPRTDRKALYVNPWFTVGFEGLTTEESRPLLDFLAARATVPENVYRHRWRRGDVVMWDNRCAMHYAVRDYDESMPRLMHRTTAAGDVPV